MKKELWNIFVYVLIGVLLCLNVFQCSRGTQGNLPPGSYTDTLTVYDTVRVEIPAPKDEKPLGSVTAKLPVSVPKQSENERKLQETVQMLRDSLANYGKIVPDHFEDLSEKVTPDSVSVEIPITQKVYETDRYRAVVSGYKPSLDDIYIPAYTDSPSKEQAQTLGSRNTSWLRRNLEANATIQSVCWCGRFLQFISVLEFVFGDFLYLCTVVVERSRNVPAPRSPVRYS